MKNHKIKRHVRKLLREFHLPTEDTNRELIEILRTGTPEFFSYGNNIVFNSGLGLLCRWYELQTPPVFAVVKTEDLIRSLQGFNLQDTRTQTPTETFALMEVVARNKMEIFFGKNDKGRFTKSAAMGYDDSNETALKRSLLDAMNFLIKNLHAITENTIRCSARSVTSFTHDEPAQ